MDNLTPVRLMKSRYDAFIRKDSDYLNSTQIHKQEISSYKETFDNITWIKLEVVDAYDNIVEFKAYFKQDDKVDVLHEKSTFVLLDNIYMYDSGELYNTKIQRNENCPCGSKKKFKKCCMKN